MKKMILLVDVGNSNICLGLYEDNKIKTNYRIKTMLDKSSDEYYIIIRNFLLNENIENVIIASVVPIVTSALKKMFFKFYNIEPIIVGNKTKTGIKLIVDDAKTVGSDLICDVLGAIKYCDEGLIIDLGTASKFLYFKDKSLLGVCIAPGVSTSTKAMVASAALLPNMELITPKKILNTSTIPCMQAGVIYGYASLVDGMIRKIKKEINNPNLQIIATGGLISLIAPLCEEKIHYIDNNLTLNGIYEIYKKNL